MTTIQVCIVMFSTYILLMFAAHGHSSDILYRALTHLGNLFGSYQVGIYLPLMMWLVQMVLTAHITVNSVWERWLYTAVVVSIYGISHVMFTYSTAKAFPRAMWAWLSITCPWLMFDSRTRADVARADPLYLAGMAKGVMEGKDADQDGKVDTGHHSPTPEEQHLAAWLDKALPDLSESSTQRALLIRALASEDLTLCRLTDAARLAGGFRVLMDMFQLTQDDNGVQLSRGEQLALATAVMKEAKTNSEM